MLGSLAGGVVGGAVVRLLLDASNFKAGLVKSKTEFSSAVRTLSSAGRSIGAIGASLTRGLTLPLTVAGIASAKLASDFQASMAKVEGLSGVAHSAMTALSNDVLDLAKTLPQSPQQLAEGLYYITSSGVEAGDAMDVLTVSAKAAAAGLGETLTVADLVTGALNVYKDSGLTAAQATDILTAAVREGKGEPEEFAQYLGQAMSAAELAGVSFGELAGSIAGLTNQQIDVARASTGVRFLLTSIAKPTPAAVEALDMVGMSVAQLQRSVSERGLAATMRDLAEQFDLTTVKGKRAFVTITGGVRGYTVAARLAETGNRDLLDIINEVENSAGDLNKAFGVASDTAEFRFKTALSSLQVTAIKFGSIILPQLAAVADGFAKMFDRLGDLPPGVQQAIVKLGLALAALGPALWIAGKALMGLSRGLAVLGEIRALTGGVTGVVAKLGATAEAVFPGLGMLFSPAGAIIVAVLAAIAAAAYVVIKNWDTIKAAIAPVVGWLVDTLKSAWEAIKTPLMELWATLQPIFKAIAAVIVGVVIVAVWELATYIGLLVKGITPLVQAFVWLINFALKPLGAAIDWVIDHWQAFTKALGDTVSSILGGLAKVAEGLAYLHIIPQDWAINLGKAAVAADKWGEDTASALDGISMPARTVSGELDNVGESATKAGRRIRTFAGMSGKELRTWEQGFKDNINSATNALEDLSGKTKVTTTQILNAFRKQLEATQNYGDNLATLVKRGLPEDMRKQLEDMGLEGAAIVAALAKANDKEFQRILDTWNKSDAASDQVVSNINRIQRAIDALHDKDVTITVTTIQRTAKLALESQYRGATGGIVTRPTMALIGEAGPEAVVPLNSAPGASPLGALGGSMDLTVNVRMDRKRFLRDADYAAMVRGR